MIAVRDRELEGVAEVMDNPVSVVISEEHVQTQTCEHAIGSGNRIRTRIGMVHLQEIHNSMAHYYTRILSHFAFKFIGIRDYWTTQPTSRNFHSPRNVDGPSYRAVPCET
jgi:hypothetical protein